MNPVPPAAIRTVSLSLDTILGSAPRDNRSFTSWISPENAARINAVAIDQLDLDAGSVLDHVLIGQQVAIGGDDYAGAATGGDDFPATLASDMDADYRWTDALDHLDDGARIGIQCRCISISRGLGSDGLGPRSGFGVHGC